MGSRCRGVQLCGSRQVDLTSWRRGVVASEAISGSEVSLPSSCSGVPLTELHLKGAHPKTRNMSWCLGVTRPLPRVRIGRAGKKHTHTHIRTHAYACTRACSTAPQKIMIEIMISLVPLLSPSSFCKVKHEHVQHSPQPNNVRNYDVLGSSTFT